MVPEPMTEIFFISKELREDWSGIIRINASQNYGEAELNPTYQVAFLTGIVPIFILIEKGLIFTFGI
jgi:hypothetical protein